MVLRLIRALLGAPGWLATVVSVMPSHREAMSRSIVANLILASEYQDHATSSSASLPVVSRKSTWHRRGHRIPASRVVTIARNAPLHEAGWRYEIMISEKRK
jgi:hypothetical protein